MDTQTTSIKLLKKLPKSDYSSITVTPCIIGYEWALDGEEIDTSIEIFQTNGRYLRPSVINLESEDDLKNLIATLQAAKKELPALLKAAKARIVKDRAARLKREKRKDTEEVEQPSGN